MKEGGNMERVQMTIRLPTEIMDKLRQQAEEMGYTVKDLIVFILYYHLKKIH